MSKKIRTGKMIVKGKRAAVCIMTAVLIVCGVIAVIVLGSAGSVIIGADRGKAEDSNGPVISEWEDAAEAAAPTAAEAARNPSGSSQVILSMGEKDGTVYISWKGEKDGPRLLRYAQDKYSLPVQVPIRAQRTKILAGDYYRFKVELTGLTAGRTYYYEIGDGTVYDSPRFFNTPDDDGEDVFAYLGDPQFDRSIKDYEVWGKLVWDMYEKEQDIEFVVMGGDMVNVPTREDHWNGFLDNCGPFSMVPLMTIPGNHEGVTSNNTYKKLFNHIDNGPDGEAFYWFEHGHCRFIMLDSSFLTNARRAAMGKRNWNAKEREIEQWLKETIEESRKTWNIVVVHHPVYGLHDMFTVSPEIRELWLPIMKQAGVDLVLCGHQHVYMRTQKIDGITHIMGVSGAKRSNYYRGFNEPVYSKSIYASGANYQVFRATRQRLEIISYNEKGSIIDAAHIEKDINLPYFRIF